VRRSRPASERPPERAAPEETPARRPSPAALLRLQQAAGNRATAQLVSRWITIGNDPYPSRRETNQQGYEALVRDYRAAGFKPGPEELARLRTLVFEGYDHGFASFAKLSEQLPGVLTIAADVEACAQQLFTAPKFERGSVLLDPKWDLARLEQELAKNLSLRAVVAGVRPEAIRRPSQITLLRHGLVADVCHRLIERLAGSRLAHAPSRDARQILYQNPQERGDMHDVRALLAIDPAVHVCICVSDPDTWGDAGEIANYYTGYLDRVSVQVGRRRPSRDLKKGALHATDATRQLLYATLEDPGARKKITDATTGAEPPTKEESAAYMADLEKHGFRPGQPPKPLMLVNFRDSGHIVSLLRQRSHPELDTGTRGFVQLLELVQRAGFIPVPMGHRVDLAGDFAKGPSLLEYWDWPCCLRVVPNRPRRVAQYRLLRFVASLFPGNVFALAMRSGATDALVYSGIPTLSIDLALEAMSARKADEAGVIEIENEEPAFPYGHPASWRRAMKRLLIFPRVFHQVFLQELRADTKFPDPNWLGEFGAKDLKLIEEALVAMVAGKSAAYPTGSPLNDMSEFSKRVAAFYEPKIERVLAKRSGARDETEFEVQKTKSAAKKENAEVRERIDEAIGELKELQRLLDRHADLFKPPTAKKPPN
jgi:hypothetical protein